MNNILKMIYMELIGELGAIPHIDRLVDAVLVAVGLYLYWGTSGNTVVPLSAIYQGANLIASIPESVPLIQAEIRQF